MGKGACFDFYDNGVNCIRSIMACVCCMLCIGPILIIVGVVVLLAKNNFDENVSTYKSAITTYQASSAWLMSQSSGNVTAGSSTASTLYVYNTTVLIVGTNADKLPSTYSISLQTNYPIDISMTRSATLIAPVSQLSTSAPASNVVNVPSSYQQDGCYSGNMDYCSGSCDTNCQDKYGKGAYADLTSNTRCKWCQYWIYSCLPLTRSTSNTWMVDNSIGSCDYVTLPNGTYTNAGFGQQPMTIVRNSLVANQHYVHFMANDDPYIVAQRLTKGTMDFGLTAAQQRVLGAVLLVIGILITISMLCVFVCLRNRMNKDPRNGAAFYGAFGRQYTPAQGVVMTPGTYGGVVYGPQSGYQTYDQPPPSAYPPQPYQQVQYQEGYQQGKGV